ncbi:PREDICTED: putative protein TPRXL [Nicotiana attenuata]|uniref:putative protein TPRXL n=1 Tax=Nicotiana attenuata TaxID=49451 RepID=UPI0009056195|nr:PREDICTED: putative protein TPRXL [Nicotiana attenuata]
MDEEWHTGSFKNKRKGQSLKRNNSIPTTQEAKSPTGITVRIFNANSGFTAINPSSNLNDAKDPSNLETQVSSGTNTHTPQIPNNGKSSTIPSSNAQPSNLLCSNSTTSKSPAFFMARTGPDGSHQHDERPVEPSTPLQSHFSATHVHGHALLSSRGDSHPHPGVHALGLPEQLSSKHCSPPSNTTTAPTHASSSTTNGTTTSSSLTSTTSARTRPRRINGGRTRRCCQPDTGTDSCNFKPKRSKSFSLHGDAIAEAYSQLPNCTLQMLNGHPSLSGSDCRVLCNDPCSLPKEEPSKGEDSNGKRESSIHEYQHESNH